MRRGAGPTDPRPASVRVALLIVGLILLAVLASWISWRWLDADRALEYRSLIPLGLLAVLGVFIRERSLGPHIGVTVGTVVLAAAIPIAGPVGTALVGFLAYLLDVRARTWRSRLFNSAMTGAVGAVGGLVYLVLGGVPARAVPHDVNSLLVQVGLPLLGAYAAMTLTNAVAVGAMSAAVRRTRVVAVTGQVLRQLGWGYLSHVVIGFLFVVLWGPLGLGPAAAVFVLGPLLVAHWTIGRAALAFREHQETVTSFVAALEQAQPSSLGHSSRVADLSESLGSVLGLGGQAAEDLRYAALLHDIGLVAVRAEIPPDSEVDEITYLSVLSTHPAAGVAALRGLDFLAGALPAIAHHHERYDGHGYPAGLAGDEIPLAARIIAVADAYDVLTTPSGRQALTPAQALGELRARGGSHLDRDVVEALSVVLARRGPGSVRPGDQQPADARAAGGPDHHALGAARHDLPDLRGVGDALPDHDLPVVSDAFARWQPEASGRVG